MLALEPHSPPPNLTCLPGANAPAPSVGVAVADYRRMLLIRRTEELILELFSQGKINGTTHTCIGQEANAVGVIGQLDPARDWVVSNHRCHGHYLAFGGPLAGLLGEIMGRTTGVCGGRGGSQHLKYGRFFSNGVLGGGAPIACGLALGEKLRSTEGVTVWCLGDGALGEGLVYESLNLAALWQLPVLFLVENNRYAQSTPVELGVAGSIGERGRPFGLPVEEIETTDVEQLRPWGARLIETVRARRKPIWAVIHTYRLAAHSKGDDHRPAAELERQRQLDPLTVHGRRLEAPDRVQAADWVEQTLSAARQAAEQAPLATLEGIAA